MIKKKDRCIAIFSAYIPPHIGGIERYTMSLVKQLVKLGYKPIVITSKYDENSLFYEECDDIVIICSYF